MAYEWSIWLADVLRDAGLAVKVSPGWKQRGLGDHLPWEPRGVVWHHDASPKGDSPAVVDFILSDIENHGAHIWIDMAGVWHILAAGRVGHTGKVKPGMPWNPEVLGIETDHTVGEEWPREQLDSLRRGTAAIMASQGWDPEDALYFHRQISATGKVDPDGLSLSQEKRKVRAIMDRTAVVEQSSRDAEREPVVSLATLRKAAKRAGWSRPPGKAARAQVAVVRNAMAAEKVRTYRAWQRLLGYTGPDADGIPGESSLAELGKRQGFTVAP